MSGYSSYKGRTTRKWLRPLLITLAVLVALGAAVFFFLQNYLVVGPDGVRLEIPWLDDFINPKPPSTGKNSPPPSDELTVIIQTPEPEISVDPQPSPSPSPTPEPERLVGPMRAYYLPPDAIEDDGRLSAAIERVRSGEINAVMLDMKPDSGKLMWPSSQPLAIKAGAPEVDDAAKRAVERLHAEGAYVIALFACFKDNAIPRSTVSTAVKTSGVTWLDRNNDRWLNPYSDEARWYLLDLLGELSELGFDEIALKNLHFPLQGKLNVIDYGGVSDSLSKADVITVFLNEARSAMGYNTALSAFVEEKTILEGEYPDGGQDLSRLTAQLDRIYYALPQKATETSVEAMRAALAALVDPKLMDAYFLPVATLADNAYEAGREAAIELMTGGVTKRAWMIFNPSGNY